MYQALVKVRVGYWLVRPEPRVGKHESELPEGCAALGVGKNTTIMYAAGRQNKRLESWLRVGSGKRRAGQVKVAQRCPTCPDPK